MSPLIRQIFVAGSPQLAALSVGGITGFPTVLLQQFSANDSSIQVDLDTSSWIASVHGLASIPSVFLSLLMQWRGRKFAYILNCLLIIVGWTLIFLAKNATVIIIGECFLGLAGNDLIMVSLLTIGEMVNPKLRSMSMLFFIMLHNMGMILITILGYFFYWKTVSLIMFGPIMIALLMACTWPESPSWLACKGKFLKCEEAFIWLRGTGEDSKKELYALIASKKEEMATAQNRGRLTLKDNCFVIIKRDFYLPVLHIFLILTTLYWSGTLSLFIYALDMYKETTGIQSTILRIALIDVVIFIGSINSVVLVSLFKNKIILLSSCLSSGIFILSISLISYLQTVNYSHTASVVCLVLLIGHNLSSSSGKALLAMNVAAELMPVKYRGLGGVFYNVMLSVLYTSSMKSTPYLYLYLDYWVTFLIFGSVDICGSLLIWKYVPETKNRTLQELEDYYNHGYFKKRDVSSLTVTTRFVNNKDDEL